MASNTRPRGASSTRPPAEAIAATVLDSLSAHIAIIDADGVIIRTNSAWREFARKNGMPEDQDGLGLNYLGICDAAAGDDDARKVAAGIRSVIRGHTEEFLHDYPCHGPDGKHWYYMRAIPLAGEPASGVVISHEDITALKRTEEILREREQELAEQKTGLEEANIALKVLLQQRENDRAELERKVLNNVKKLVLPYVEKLGAAPLRPREKTLVRIIDEHLNDIISPFLQRLNTAHTLLTPQEIQVASLIRDGKSSKEIADLLNVSVTTINFHRKNLREKFGLTHRQTNLRSYLMSLT